MITTNTAFSWTLDSEELKLIDQRYPDNRHATHRLAFAVMLRFFQINLRYPSNGDKIPKKYIIEISDQLGCPFYNLRKFDWESTTSKRLRKSVREYLGYRKANAADAKEMISWLVETAFPSGIELKKCYDEAYQFLANKKLEAFTDKSMHRHIKSAFTLFEERFYAKICKKINPAQQKMLQQLIENEDHELTSKKLVPIEAVKLHHLKKEARGTGLSNVLNEIAKLDKINQIELYQEELNQYPRKLLLKYYRRVLTMMPSHLESQDPNTRYSTLAIFCHIKKQIISDSLADIFNQIVHRVKFKSEKILNKEIIKNVKKVDGKFDILHRITKIAAEQPNETIENAIYPEVSQGVLLDLATELDHKGRYYTYKVHEKMCSSYSHYQRRVLIPILEKLDFVATNHRYEPLLRAIEFIKKHADSTEKHYPSKAKIPLKGIINNNWNDFVITKNDADSENAQQKIVRANYEIAVFEELRKHLRCKAIWVNNSYRYRNPDEDLPNDFDENQDYYFDMLGLPKDANELINKLKKSMDQSLTELNDTILSNDKVNITNKKVKQFTVTPYQAQEEPENLLKLQRKISDQWSTTNLIDILKETELRVNFSECFNTVASRTILPKKVLQKRLLLCLYALGSNTGLKRTSSGNHDSKYDDLKYVKRKFISAENIRNAIREVVNAIFFIRDPDIWGDATTGCACDSTKLSAWDQNLMAEWHKRYKGRGVMIYWHVENKSTCIYSQLKTCSSSEVSSMIEGVLRHCTDMKVDKTYTDTHGQSVVGFAFTHLLGFDLLPRIKRINKQKLYLPNSKFSNKYKNLDGVLASSINWKLIREQYREIVKYTAALRAGTADTDVIMRRFTNENKGHPVYKALIELGKAVKTIFLCRYLSSESLRIEINESLNVVERLNGVMDFVFYGRLGEITTNVTDDQELAILSLHLLQVCMVYINTLMIQEILASDHDLMNCLTDIDKRALTPLLHAHINPYGLFPLDLNTTLDFKIVAEQAANESIASLKEVG